MDDNKHYIKVKRHKWPDEIEAEKKRTRKRFLVLLSCVLCFALGLGISSLANQTTNTNNTQSNSFGSDKFNEIYDIMKNDWYFGKDIKDLDSFLIDNAIRGLTTNEYDIHSNYLDKEQASSFIDKMEGTVTGIGINYINLDSQFLVVNVFMDSPAEKAGVKKGDIITKINGISLEGKETDEVVDLVTGEEGTSVQIEFDRNGSKHQVEIVRDVVETTVLSYMKEGVGVLEISSVSENTANTVEKHLKKLKEKGAKSIVIDLRNNTGGYVNVLVEIAGYFVGADKVVIYQENRDGSIEEFKTPKKEVYDFDHISVLINEKTASAAEGLAACLRYHTDATLIGTTTYGKGTVQIPMLFKDGSYFKYTIAEWLTPGKEKINNKGIKPDVEVHLPEALEYSNSINEDTKEYKIDSVGLSVKEAQIFLKFLGYEIDRTDGYFSAVTDKSVRKFQTDHNLTVNGIINENLRDRLLSDAVRKYYFETDKYDSQLNKAIELMK